MVTTATRGGFTRRCPHRPLCEAPHEAFVRDTHPQTPHTANHSNTSVQGEVVHMDAQM